MERFEAIARAILALKFAKRMTRDAGEAAKADEAARVLSAMADEIPEGRMMIANLLERGL